MPGEYTAKNMEIMLQRRKELARLTKLGDGTFYETSFLPAAPSQGSTWRRIAFASEPASPPVVSGMFLWLDPDKLGSGQPLNIAGAEGALGVVLADNLVWADSSAPLVSAIGEIPGLYENSDPALVTQIPASQTHPDRDFQLVQGDETWHALAAYRNGHTVLWQTLPRRNGFQSLQRLPYATEHTSFFVANFNNPGDIADTGSRSLVFSIGIASYYFAHGADSASSDTFGHFDNSLNGKLPFRQGIWMIVVLKRSTTTFECERHFDDGSSDSASIDTPWEFAREGATGNNSRWRFAYKQAGSYGDFLNYNRILSDDEIKANVAWLKQRWRIGQPELQSDPLLADVTGITANVQLAPTVVAATESAVVVDSQVDFTYALWKNGVISSQGSSA